MAQVIVVIGAGSIGQAIARRVSAGKHVLLADLRQDNADAAAKTLSDAGFDVSTATVDVSSRASVQALVKTATARGEVFGLVHAAGVSPTQAPPDVILKVDLYGTALVLEEFGNVIARGGAGVVIASQSGHRLPSLPVEQNRALATTPTEDLLALVTSSTTTCACAGSRRALSGSRTRAHGVALPDRLLDDEAPNAAGRADDQYGQGKGGHGVSVVFGG